MIILGVITFFFWAFVVGMVLLMVIGLFGAGVSAVSDEIKSIREFRKGLRGKTR